MSKFREILLNQYIGAVAIGVVFANAVNQLVGSIVTPIFIGWERSHEHSSVLAGGSGVAWVAFIRPFVSAILLLLSAFALTYWLYLRQEATAEPEEVE